LLTVAVKVVLWLLHSVLPALDVMLTAGATLLPTVTVIAFEVTVAVLGHVAFEVILTVILGLPVNVVVE
jgi:hypothetical protein